jgi:hypothetical protein
MRWLHVPISTGVKLARALAGVAAVFALTVAPGAAFAAEVAATVTSEVRTTPQGPPSRCTLWTETNPLTSLGSRLATALVEAGLPAEDVRVSVRGAQCITNPDNGTLEFRPHYGIVTISLLTDGAANEEAIGNLSGPLVDAIQLEMSTARSDAALGPGDPDVEVTVRSASGQAKAFVLATPPRGII